jgi:hypothetical protein
LIEERFGCLEPHPSLTWIFDHVREQDADRALLEHEYLDGDYRTEYANFYVKTFRALPDRCERLHFWAGERYLGFSSIRPVEGRPVCRTMLDPGPAYEDAVSCVVVNAAHPYGRTLRVPGFPFISQDGQYARCAHAVIWMVAKYHHLQNRTPDRTISDIVTAAAEDESERVVPSRGLTDHQIGSALRRLGLGAIQYRLRPEPGGESDLPDADSVEQLVLRYLNSGLPLLLGTRGHLTALIGAQREAAGAPLELVRCDDESGPYCRTSMQLDPAGDGSGLGADDDPDDTWEQLFVPLPGRIFLLGEELEPGARRLLGDVLRQGVGDVDEFATRRLRFRAYVCDSRLYKYQLEERGMADPFVRGHRQVAAPRWVWVTEVQDEELAEAGEPCVLGELAVDATSSAERLNALWANLPGVHAIWSSANPSVVAVDSSTEPYSTGTLLGL